MAARKKTRRKTGRRVGRRAGRKTGRKATTNRKGFWSRNLSAGKVQRVLRELEWDGREFQKTYERLPGQGGGPRRPSDKEIQAFEAYQESGDFDAFRRALGNPSSVRVNSAIQRCLRESIERGED